MIHTKDTIAELIQIGAWKDGQFPGEKKLPYRTRQLVFEVRGETDKTKLIRINIKDNSVASMKYNELKKGTKITNFKMLLSQKTIINPTSSFEIHHDNAIF